MSELKTILQNHIRTHGAMDVASFMDFCLAHPIHGYYMTRDPFGRSGDFITAPEVSQLFGEMIGVWCADMWMKMNMPERFHLLECGPGRGTLMKDLWRATQNIPGFHAACHIHLLETSPVLSSIQQENLLGLSVTWHKNLETFRADAPVIIIGNEFFDALPIQQAIFHADQWYMRRIACDAQGDFVFVRGEILMSEFGDGHEGDIREFSPIQDDIWQNFLSILGRVGGGALMIDYGGDVDFANDTLQAVKAHQYKDIFDDLGNVDLTSHVAFGRLKKMARLQGLKAMELMPQGVFLQNLAIQKRAEILIQKNPDHIKNIMSGLERLIAPDQMGNLFQVLCVYDKNLQPPLGFS